MRRRPETALRVAVAVVATAALLELLLVAVRRLPAATSVRPLTQIGRELYLLDRPYLQMLPAAMRWDPALGYTLRPGSFRFVSTEFDTLYRVNSAGLRDDEASLDGPEVIVLGDSFAMGWGVDQEEAFPQVLERLLGRRVLNAAVSSYGTARELRLLGTLDTSRAGWLVIQFCNNDYFENRRFVEEGPGFAVQSEASYRAMVVDHRRSSRYWPGRYAATLLARRAAALGRLLGLASPPPGPDPADPAAQRAQVATLLEVLRRAPVDLSRFRVALFELNSHNRHREAFTPALRVALEDRAQPEWLREMLVLDLASSLGPEHFYVLDDHLRPSGHRVVAEELAAVIGAARASGRGTTATAPAAAGSTPPGSPSGGP